MRGAAAFSAACGGSALDGFRAGACTLWPFETAEAGDVTGKRLVHRQCHVGLDTLSWARNGALVTGLDCSEPAIEAARALAADLAIGASFVVADTMHHGWQVVSVG